MPPVFSLDRQPARVHFEEGVRWLRQYTLWRLSDASDVDILIFLFHSVSLCLMAICYLSSVSTFCLLSILTINVILYRVPFFHHCSGHWTASPPPPVRRKWKSSKFSELLLRSIFQYHIAIYPPLPLLFRIFPLQCAANVFIRLMSVMFGFHFFPRQGWKGGLKHDVAYTIWFYLLRILWC